jgi:Uma2 family endonuclease
MAVAVKHHRFTVDQYHRMIEAGILTKDDRVELIEGEIVEVAPIGTRHASTVDRITRLLVTRLGDRAIVRVQGPILLPIEVSEPQPDVAVLRPRADFYRAAHPQPDDVLLVIEVADTTVEPDRRWKLPLYARAGLREAWLADVNAERLELYDEPGPAGYRRPRVLARGEAIAARAFPDLTLDVADLLG